MSTERASKVCSNKKCYGSKATIPCYTHHELKVLCKEKGLPSKPTKKEMCEDLKIPYYTFRTLQMYGGFGAYDYPSCNIFGTKNTYDVISRKKEGRLFGMLLTHIILDALDDALVEKDEIYHIDHDKFGKTLPKSPITTKHQNYTKQVAYVIERLNKSYGFEFNEETINKLASAAQLQSFCYSFSQFVDILAKIPFFKYKQDIGKKKIAFKEYEAVKFWPFKCMSACGAVLQLVWPELWDSYKFLCYTNTKKDVSAIYVYIGCFFGQNIPETRDASYEMFYIYNSNHKKGELVMTDLPYIMERNTNYYIVPNDFDKDSLFECQINEFFRTIRKDNLFSKLAPSKDINVMMNGMLIASFQHYSATKFYDYLEHGLPNVTSEDINQSAKKTLAYLNIQSKKRIKYEPKVLKNAAYAETGWNKIRIIEEVLKTADRHTWNSTKDFGVMLKDLDNKIQDLKKSFTERDLDELSSIIGIRFTGVIPPKQKDYESPGSSEIKTLSEGVYCKPYREEFVVYGENTKKIKPILKATGGRLSGNLDTDPMQGWLYSSSNLRKLKVEIMFTSQKYLKDLIIKLISKRPDDINHPDDIKEAIIGTLPELKHHPEFNTNFDLAYKSAKKDIENPTLRKSMENIIRSLSRGQNGLNNPEIIKGAIMRNMPEIKDYPYFDYEFNIAYKNALKEKKITTPKEEKVYLPKEDYGILSVDYKKYGSGYLVTGVGAGPASEVGEWREDLQGYYLTPKKFAKVKPALDMLAYHNV